MRRSRVQRGGVATRAVVTLPCAIVTLLVIIAGCASTGPVPTASPATAPPAPPRVVVTTDILGDVTRSVLGDQANVEVLVPHGTDPRTYTPNATQDDAIRKAQLIIRVGLGIEPGMADAITAAQAAGVPVIEIGPKLNPLPLARSVGSTPVPGPNPGSSATSPSSPDTHAPDPHVWLDPDRVAHAAQLIGDAVAKLPGTNPTTIAGLVAGYRDRIAQADVEIQTALSPIPEADRVIATVHDDLGYFAERYGFTIAVVLDSDSNSSGADAGVDIATGAARVSGAGATTIVAGRSPAASAAARAVADAATPTPRTVTLDIEALGPPGSGADTYVGLIVTNARALSSRSTTATADGPQATR